jgi:MFS family permease
VILCPTSINATMFNLGRVATGASSAALFNGGMIIIGLTVPLRYRPAPLALVPTMFGIFPILGPIIGQGITARLSWKWCYWVELL